MELLVKNDLACFCIRNFCGNGHIISIDWSKKLREFAFTDFFGSCSRKILKDCFKNIVRIALTRCQNFKSSRFSYL